MVGVNYKAAIETKDSTFSMGKVAIGYNPGTARFIINDTANRNELGKILDYHKNDEIDSVYGVKISPDNGNSFFKNFGSSSKVGDSLIINVVRKDSSGNYFPVRLKATMTKFPVIKYNVLQFNTTPSAEQMVLRNAWLKPRA